MTADDRRPRQEDEVDARLREALAQRNGQPGRPLPAHLEVDFQPGDDSEVAPRGGQHGRHADVPERGSAPPVEDHGEPDLDGLEEDEDAAEEAPQVDLRGRRLGPVDIHHVTFPRASFTRRGYDERSVDEFLSQVETEFSHLLVERSDLRAEVSRLRRQVRRVQQAPVPEMEEAQAQAVRLLAKAQQLADQYVAEAEDYSKRLSQDARQQYDELVAEARDRARRLVDEAQQAAQEAAERAVVEGAPPAPREQSDEERRALEQQVAYLRTFGQVCRSQLRAYLEALLQDVEEEWGKAESTAGLAAARPGDPGPAAVGSVLLPVGAPAEQDASEEIAATEAATGVAARRRTRPAGGRRTT